MTTIPSRGILDAELAIARNTYDEAVRVTEAFHIQLIKRRQHLNAVPSWDQDKRSEYQIHVMDAEYQLAAAERREFAAWADLEHLRKQVGHHD
jgi:hypothetical protein